MAYPTQFWGFIDGQIVNASDLGDTENAIRNLVGEALETLLGIGSFIPASGAACSPLAVVLNSPATGEYTIGGAGQFVVLGGRVIDNCPAFTQSVTNNSTGSLRTDVIGILYINANSSTTASRQCKDSSGNITTQTVYQVTEQVEYSYTVGSTTPPMGYTAFALIDVPNGSSTPQNLRYQIPTAATAIAAVLTGQAGSTVALADAVSEQAGYIWLHNFWIGSGFTYGSAPGPASGQVDGFAAIETELLMSGSGAQIDFGSSSTRLADNQLVLGPVGGVGLAGAVQFSVGTGAPTSSTLGYAQPGSLFVRTDGSAGARWYISTGSAWVAIASV
jgi:hypothetical protein